jgi:hypothetical protein
MIIDVLERMTVPNTFDWPNITRMICGALSRLVIRFNERCSGYDNISSSRKRLVFHKLGQQQEREVQLEQQKYFGRMLVDHGGTRMREMRFQHIEAIYLMGL